MANWIDPRQNEPWFVPYGPPVAKKNPASRDLVVCQHYAIDNRWRQTNDLVNYDDVERPSTRRLESKNWHIRRLKMCNLPRNESTYLLLNLEQSDLVVLEIDRLELLQKNLGDEVTTFRFPNLEILSIGKIVTVDEYDNRLPEVQTPVLFKALVLKEVDLGKCFWFIILMLTGTWCSLLESIPNGRLLSHLQVQNSSTTSRSTWTSV